MAIRISHWHYAKHVLHAERDAGPMQGLDFRHKNQEIRFPHSSGRQRCFNPYSLLAAERESVGRD